jgi:hypothetical protein
MNENQPLLPREVLESVSQALPETVREQVIVVGALAAGFHFFADREGMEVRTKDADCLLSPRLEAVAAGTTLANELFDANWTYHPIDEFPEPGSPETPEEKLPVLRLDPPDGAGWFLEILGAHDADDHTERSFDRIETDQGHFALASFRYLALCERNPLGTDVGVRIARPETMALANLLAHPEIRPDLVSQPMHGLKVKRSNKDLGRVLALAALSGDAIVEGWAETWWSDLRFCFPGDAVALAKRAGSGLRALVESPEDLREAHHTCVWGLLAHLRPTSEALLAVGRRLIQDAIEPLETHARDAADPR